MSKMLPNEYCGEAHIDENKVQEAAQFGALSKGTCSDAGYSAPLGNTSQIEIAFVGPVSLAIFHRSSSAAAAIRMESFLASLLPRTSKAAPALSQRPSVVGRRPAAVFPGPAPSKPNGHEREDEDRMPAAVFPAPAPAWSLLDDHPSERGDSIPLPQDFDHKIDLNVALEDSDRKGASEFELNLGKCIDTLNADVPQFAEREMDWDIYDKDVEMSDPSGPRLHGIDAYKRFFGTVRALRAFMFDKVEVSMKLRYDWSGKRIIVRWHSQWIMKGAVPGLPSREPAYIDAVSYFHLNDQGLIVKHLLDQVMFNGDEVATDYAAGYLGLNEYAVSGLYGRVPVAYTPGAGSALKFRDASKDISKLFVGMTGSALTMQSAIAGGMLPASSTDSDTDSSDQTSGSTKKGKNLRRSTPPWRRLPGSCDGMWDCMSPEQCCDFKFAKFCCTGGSMIPAFRLPDKLRPSNPEPQLIPIPIPAGRGPSMPVPEGRRGEGPHAGQLPLPGDRWYKPGDDFIV